MCSLALHPTVERKKKRNHYFATTDCLTLQNLTQVSQHAGTATLNTFLCISNKFQMPPGLKYGNEVSAQYILGVTVPTDTRNKYNKTSWKYFLIHHKLPISAINNPCTETSNEFSM
jgi:hypothetical protein